VAWVQKLPSGRWRVFYRDEDEKVRAVRGTYAHKGVADDVRKALDASKLPGGVFVDPALGRTPFHELADKYLESARPPVLKPKTAASYESLLRSRILPTFGSRLVHSIKPSDVDLWVAEMVGDGLSASRIRQAHVVLRSILEMAARDGYIGRNPAQGARLPRLEHREAPYFEPHVVDAIAEAIGAPYSALVAVMGVCGLRWGEAAALRRRHVDALRRRLLVEESLAEISGRLVFGPTKSHTRRSVPLSPVVMARLNESLAGKGTGALVFTAPEGGPLRYQNFLSRRWHPTLERLGLPVVGVHVLRHSAAARMIERGADAKTLQKILGHRSAAFSLTVYGHLFDADLDALAARLDDDRKAQ
jgi:integrase